ncbi:FKBP-type peptidyl-prolyl cis-trans isomerase [Lewinella sp. 4G2]|uniref:FKBP-type peptidyl-prolyl cis-trans isomerase n=1 Tax=Lewinella sp. 4G2 TaxID=1803372 RepID=UPI0007B47012|nr:FKBP-type peptidyl-prolyl cis-trans isomerase [Lewinella sp. 4G2]OAV44422.1 hypothetical protein A3850_007910 [Lewinella sp. 4G2]
MVLNKSLPFRLFVLFLASLCCSSCQDKTSTAPAKDAATRSAIEERLVLELSPTDDRAGRQRNAIINRAIDQHYDVVAASEGYFYEVIEPGSTVGFAEGDYVEAHYQGRFLNGKVFDSSRSRNQKLAFRIGDLIPAWNLAIPKIKNGGTIRLLAPSDLAYGADGLVTPKGDTLVPAHAVLEFLIEEVESVEPPDGL